MKKQNVERFYFLEPSGKEISPVLAALEKRYATRCYSRLNRMNVIKFLIVPPAADQPPRDELHDCPIKHTVKPMSE